MSKLEGGPANNKEGEWTHPFVRTALMCNGAICTAVYERVDDGRYVFQGVDHLFEVGPDKYETRRESADEWTQRTKREQAYAPSNHPSLFARES